MTDASLIAARPPHPARLLLLFHGVGSSARDLLPLAQALAQADPQALVVSVDAPHASGLGQGREWFSVMGVTEQNRPARIAAVLPQFLATVAHWQREAGVGPEATTLIGFSQGAIMSLESTQTEGPSPAARIVSLAGRLAEPARRAPESVRFHLIHGEADPVMPVVLARTAAQQLQALGASVTLDTLPGLGHGIDQRAFERLLARLGEAA